jgi:hypothetical protein
MIKIIHKLPGQKMELFDYIKNNGLKQGWFAKQIPCSETHLSLIMHKKKIPSILLIHRIEHLTNGAVTKNDFTTLASTRKL